MPRCLPMLTSFFNRFLIDVYSQLRPPESQKSSPRCSESTIFQKIAFRNWHGFLIDFGANLAPFCFPKSTKNAPKTNPKTHQNFDRFLRRFFLVLGSVLGAKNFPDFPGHRPQGDPETNEPPKRHQEHPRDPHQTSRVLHGSLQGHLQATQEGPRDAQEAPKDASQACRPGGMRGAIESASPPLVVLWAC